MDQHPNSAGAAGIAPCFAEIANRPPLGIVEHTGASKAAPVQGPLEDSQEFTPERQDASSLRLGMFGPEMDRLARQVHVPPLERFHLAEAPAGQVQKQDRILEGAWELGM